MIKYVFEYIEIDRLSPNPLKLRLRIEKENLMALVESIRQYGVFTPILVGKTTAGLQIIAGERRWRAAKIAGLTMIPAMIIEATALELILLFIEENIQREKINLIELAVCIQKLLKRPGLTIRTISNRIKISEAQINKILKITHLPDSIQESYLNNKISDQELIELIEKNPIASIHRTQN